MKQIEISKELLLDDVVDILSLEANHQFVYKKEQNGMRCVGPFFVKGRYSTKNEVKNFEDVFEFDIFASSEKLDGEKFELVYTGYKALVDTNCCLLLYFDVHGIYEEEEKEEDVLAKEEMFLLGESESEFTMMEELFDEKDHVITSYSFVVVKPKETYDSIAKRYGVDVKLLREVNMNKEIREKDLLVLPYMNTLKN